MSFRRHNNRRLFTRVASGAAAQAITPASYSGLYLWAQPETGITIDTGVSQWADQSGNGRHLVQAVGGLQPTYNADTPDYLGFAGAGVRLTAGVAADWTFLHNGAPSTIVLVVYTTGGSGHILDTSGDGTKPGISISRDGGDIYYRIYNASFFIASQYQTVSASNWHCLILRQDQGNVPNDYTFTVDNVTTSSADYELFGSPGVPALTAPASTFCVMNTAAGGSAVAGRLAEVIVYDAYLSDAEIDELYTEYLQGIHPSLP